MGVEIRGMNKKLSEFVKFIEFGGIITDVTMYNAKYSEIEFALKLQELVIKENILGLDTEQLESLVKESKK